MKNAIVFYFLLANLISIQVFAQEGGASNVVGINYEIDSKVLNQSRQIQVYLPDDYESAHTEYPVLYVLDGQRFFLYAVSLLASFKQYKLTPNFIIVGITNKYPQRFRHFSSGANNFAAFVQEELVPFVNEKFQTNHENLLFGWEYAGSLALKIMTASDSMFKGYLLASPFPLGHSIKEMDSTMVSNDGFNQKLFFGVSQNEGMVGEGTDELANLLSRQKVSEEKWSYVKLENEEHRSTSYSVLYHGLRDYFKTYPELQIDDLLEFEKEGGLEYAHAYNYERAKKYGFDTVLSKWTKFTIIRSAIRADRFEQFDKYVKVFKTPEFINSLRGSRPYDIAEYYERNKKFEEAIAIYKILEQKEPPTARPVESLLRIYSLQNNNKEMTKYSKIVKQLAGGKK